MTTKTKYGGRAHPKRQTFRRRQYLVDRRQQLTATVRVTGLVFLLLLTLNTVVAWQSYTVTSQIMVTDPNVAERLQAAALRNQAILVGISLVILAMVVVRSIMLTHRTAGAVSKIVQSLEAIEEGNLHLELKLRSQDTIKAIEGPFNNLVATLALEAQEDQRSMEKLADEIEEHGNPVDAEMLRRLAEARGKFAE